jgi:DNA-binding transcriptional MocR family regulator
MTSWIPELATDRPRYLAIADAIAADLSSGRLNAGDRLPPQRDLAFKLGVTIGTVTRAYQEAAKRGLLSGEVGRGSYLRQPSASYEAINSTLRVVEPGVLDMQVSSPPRVHQVADLEAALRDITRDPNWPDYLDYSPAAGVPAQRAAGARWLAKAGLNPDPSQVVLSAGAQSALVSSLSTLTQPGDKMLIEPLTYPTMQPISQHLGLVLKPLRMDEHGIIPDSIDQAARHGDVRIVYLVPTLNNPTTITLSKERREAIAEIARRHDLIIVEDDVFRLLAPNPPPTIASMAPERTCYITSLSKTVAPGLRIAFTLPPTGRTEEIIRKQMMIGGRLTALSGEVARRWIDSGVADKVLDNIKSELAARRQIVLETFGNQQPACPPGAMFIWLDLPAYWRPADFASAAQAIGIKVTPGAAFAMDPAAPHHAVRACLGPAPSHIMLRDGLEKLARLREQGTMVEFQSIA